MSHAIGREQDCSHNNKGGNHSFHFVFLLDKNPFPSSHCPPRASPSLGYHELQVHVYPSLFDATHSERERVGGGYYLLVTCPRDFGKYSFILTESQRISNY